ncbi:MAG: Fe2+-dependent dioxygenase [Aquisalimonadaceae bacterium]
MIIVLQNVLSAEDLSHLREAIPKLTFEDGQERTGHAAAMVKYNRQAVPDSPGLAPLQALVTSALQRDVLFQLAAMPLRVLPPIFSSYETGMEYGEHTDDALIGPIRTDMSLTVFLSDPNSYDGGELIIESSTGYNDIKLPAGDAVLYPATAIHRVAPVTRGERLAAVTWIQSSVRDSARRELVFELDMTRRSLLAQQGKTRDFDTLSKCHANLLRMWADA